ncbi:MAG: proline racemase family protein, partial [Acidobacteriota bacterium]|nr:proline racemase family protein [Acidobacteriota bacterium]
MRLHAADVRGRRGSGARGRRRGLRARQRRAPARRVPGARRPRHRLRVGVAEDGRAPPRVLDVADRRRRHAGGCPRDRRRDGVSSPRIRVDRVITVVGCHAGGEVGNVVVGGVIPPPGATVFERMLALRADDRLRRLLLREPRGSVAVHANLIVPTARDDCAAGFIIMEPTEYPAMSGSNTICVATVLLETGMVAMEEPETRLRLEAPAGVVEVTARCTDGRCESVELTN